MSGLVGWARVGFDSVGGPWKFPPTGMAPGPARWSWALSDWRALPTWEMAHATGRSLKARLTGTSEASWTVDGTTVEASIPQELISDLWIIRNGQPLFRGRVGPSTDTLDGSKHSVQFTAGDYRAALQRRILFDGDPMSFTNIDPATIAWSLINTVQGRTGGDMSILNGADTSTITPARYTPPETLAAQLIRSKLQAGPLNWDFSYPKMPPVVVAYHLDLSKQFFAANPTQSPTTDWRSTAISWLNTYITNNPQIVTNVTKATYNSTTQRTITYPAGQSIGQAVEALSLMDAGFNWDIVPNLTAPNQVFTVWPSRGQSSQRVIDYPGQVASLTRSVDPGQYANSIRETGNTGLAAVSLTASDIATRDEGRWEAQHGDTSLLDAASVSSRASYDLANSQNITPSYTVKLRPGSWGGPTDIWLGDAVLLLVNSGRLAVADTLRVWEVDIDLDDADNETVTLTLAALDPFKRARSRQYAFRLTQLERR